MSLQYFATATTVIDGVRYAAGDEVPVTPKLISEIQRGTVIPVPRVLSSIETAVKDNAQSTSEDLFQSGLSFIAGNRKSLAASEIGWWRLTNPAGSGHNLYVSRVLLFAVTDSLAFSFYRDSTVAGTLHAPLELNRSNLQAVVGAAEHGVSAPGGTQVELSGQASPGSPYQFGDMGEIVLALAPGQALSASIQAPAGLAAGVTTEVVGSVAWLASPIPV